MLERDDHFNRMGSLHRFLVLPPRGTETVISGMDDKRFLLTTVWRCDIACSFPSMSQNVSTLETINLYAWFILTVQKFE